MAGSDVDFSDVYDVVKMRFSIISPDEIIRNSVVPVFNVELNEGSSLDTPKCNGVNDPRMGPANPNSVICPTDEKTFGQDCPGYFGHIELAKPVFWPEFMMIIMNILRFTCYNCSKLLMDRRSNEKTSDRLAFDVAMRLQGRARMERLKNVNPKKTCPHCQAPQPKYSKEQNTKIIAEFKTGDGGVSRRIQFSAERIRTIFSRMTNEDIEALGFNRHFSRPEWMICTVFPVPPPTIRPSSMRIDTSQRSEDDLTVKLCEMVKFNKELYKKLQSDANYSNIDDYIQLLQVHVAAFVNNDLNGGYKVMRKSGGTFKSIVSRFKGKTGRIRGNLMGKRANFSARSVITGDPSISVEEVGVPYQIAMDLTYPETVTPLNIKEMTRLVHNGPKVFPGAKSIRPKGKSALKQLYPLEQLNQLSSIKLQIGDVVNRHLRDGDLVLFNRQPSLHRMSMMSHKVKVLNGYTFRLQLAVVAPYNAD